MDLKSFASKHNREWKELFDAEKLSEQNRQKIRDLFTISAFPSDANLVVFGSIARGESTPGSDIDWTLLVDGQADPDLYNAAHAWKELLEEQFPSPGGTGLFGHVTFSHDLIHYIGGEDDTNHNLTKRILLLLESQKAGAISGENDFATAYDRVVRGIIHQYIENDSGFSSLREDKTAIPRFLLNDIVRFWRTMCVDFAYKQREQQGEKWALRNIKLRMSRKLIFVKGLLMCFVCFREGDISREQTKEILRNCVSQEPLKFILSSLINAEAPEASILKMYDAYNEFLRILSDEEQRDHLQKLDMLDVYHDSIYMEARKHGDKFQEGLNEIFIQSPGRLQDFTFKYGIF